MSAQSPNSWVEWFQSLPIPWLVGGPNGQNEAKALGTVLDQQVSLIKDATKAHFPSYAPADALPHLGGDRQLIQGIGETNQAFALRCKFAWEQWAWAGTPLGLLLQLYYTFQNAAGQAPNFYIVQQNGKYFTLTGAPPVFVTGWDPTSVLTIGSLGTLGTQFTPAAVPVGVVPKNIPAGQAWWTFDSRTDFCSRFAVIVPLPTDAVHTLTPFRSIARATFTGTEDGSVANPWPTVTWPNRGFSDTTYKVLAGVPVVTSGGPVVCAVVGSSKTTTTAQVMASGSFAGYVDVLAWNAGDNPLCSIPPLDLSILRKVIQTWRRASQTCVGIYVTTNGAMWGLPEETWGSGGNWGPSEVVRFTP